MKELIRGIVDWWPLGVLDTAVLMAGALFMAQALNLAWERRDLIGRMSTDERRAGTGLLILFGVVAALWTADLGVPAVLFLSGAIARWFARKVVELGDAGRIGATWEDMHDHGEDA